MKKTILLFLFILPVIIVLLILAIIGFVGRTLLVVPIERVYIDQRIFDANENFHQQYGTNNLILLANVGDIIEFMEFVIVEPRDATTAISFDISNPDAIAVENGRIRVLQNMRTSDPATGVELTITHGASRFFSVFIRIDTDNTRFDYFGFNFDLFERGISGENWHIDYALGIGYRQDLVWAEDIDDYDYVFTPHLLIEKNYIKEDANYTLPIGAILERGFNIAPINLLNYGTTIRKDFLASLKFSSSDTNILEIIHNAETNEFSAKVNNAGEVYITIITNFLGVNFQIVIPIIIA
ncbi:MAG: hypothetical protein FWE03_05170 [Firmicutes bacterium]|nr:hypothetical protein [Bacillota bacterium]